MSKFSIAMKRFGGFLKRNAFYLLIILCIASVATVIALAVTYDHNRSVMNVDDAPVLKPDDPEPAPPIVNDDDDDEKQPATPEKKLTFLMPCNGQAADGYAAAELVWSETLHDFRTHAGIDFVSDDLNVYASAEGTIEETGYNNLDGYYIVISHADGYKTTYKSLAEQSTLQKNDKVTQGQLIGQMSTSQGTESLEGNHLHFEITKDGAYVNPLDVLLLDEK